MTEPEVLSVEARLGHRLPADYRRFVLALDPDPDARVPFDLYPAGHFLRVNLRIRERRHEYDVRLPDGAGGFLPEQPCPPDWLAVRDNGGGDDWLVCRSRKFPGIYHRCHVTQEVTPQYPSFRAAAAAWARPAWPGDRDLPPEPATHPLLGDLRWWPGDRRWTGTVPGSAGEPVRFRLTLDWWLTLGVPRPPAPPTTAVTRGTKPPRRPAAPPARDRSPEAMARTEQLVLKAVPPVIVRVAAAERELFAAALPALVRAQNQGCWYLPELPKLSAGEVRARLVLSRLSAWRHDRGLSVALLYDGGEAFGWEWARVEVAPRTLTVKGASIGW